MSVGDRLREERERLKMSQSTFAARAGIHRNTQVRYERNKTHLHIGYIEAIRAMGVDDTYVVTGNRGSDAGQPLARKSATPQQLVLDAIADHFGIGGAEIDEVVRWIELLQSSEIAGRQLDITEEAKRLTWRMLMDHKAFGSWANTSDDGRVNQDLLFDLIQRFETRLGRAQANGVVLTAQVKARAIVALYVDAKKVGYVDTKTVDDAIQHWANCSATGDRLSNGS